MGRSAGSRTCARLRPADPGLSELQALTRLRDDQVRSRTAAINQLTALLGAHWPGPVPQSAARLGEARLAAFLRRNSYRGGKSAAELLA
jgi:hypothetical protein